MVYKMYYSRMCNLIAKWLICWCYLGRDLWDAILFGFTYRFGDTNQSTLFNCASSGFPNAAVYGTWHLPSSCTLLFWCAPIALVSSCCLSCGTLVPRRCYVECCACQVQDQRCGREPGTFLVRCKASTRLMLGHDAINNLLHFYTVFNILISLSCTSH